MSTQQQKSELLTFGYVNNTYNSVIPRQLMKLIQLFYDDWIYWALKNDKLKQFITAKYNEKVICPKSFTVQGIEFQTHFYPNGCNREMFKGTVLVALTIKHMPTNIGSVQLYSEIRCEPSNSSVKGLSIVKDSKWAFRPIMCQLSELKDLKYICFNYMINIKYIKYKKDCNKINYYSPINKIQKLSQFTWNINELLLQKCIKMIYKQGIYSDNFNSNNWCLSLFANGNTVQKPQFRIKCLHFPHNTKAMDVKLVFNAMGMQNEAMLKLNDKMHSAALTIDKNLKEYKSLSFTVILEIINIYDENDEKIEESHYEQYGIVINT